MKTLKDPSKLRRLIIDTDTGSDDVWAIIQALRATDKVQVEAITVVHGNMELDLCTKNALIAIDVAATYRPPVYKGAAQPLLRKPMGGSAEVHGEDGLGNMNLPHPSAKPQPRHAVDAIIDLARADPGQVDFIALGPLTNLALAIKKEPALPGLLGQVTILGGAGLGQGNATPAAEFNIYSDAEAAKIVLDSGLDALWVAWDCIYNGCEITAPDIAALRAAHSPVANFCVDCTRSLYQYEAAHSGRDAFGVIDSIAMTAYLFPETVHRQYAAYCDIETKPGLTYGYFSIDKGNLLKMPPNARVCEALDPTLYKQNLFHLLTKP